MSAPPKYSIPGVFLLDFRVFLSPEAVWGGLEGSS